jgi:hypothetical protein
MERTEPGPSKRAKVRMNEKNGRMAHRRIVAGRGIIRNYGRNNNSPSTGFNIDASSHVPPVLTKTWFHTGAYFQEGAISMQFENEYYREGHQAEGDAGLSDQQLEAMLIPDTTFPPSPAIARRVAVRIAML